jgi:hypothetical protein
VRRRSRLDKLTKFDSENEPEMLSPERTTAVTKNGIVTNLTRGSLKRI